MLTNILHRETRPFTPTELSVRRDAPQGARAPIGARRYVPAAVEHQVVAVSPSDQVMRRTESCGGVTVEMVQPTGSDRTEFWYRGRRHLLVMFDHGTRRHGETRVETLRSSLRDVERKLIFVPAALDYEDWHEPRGSQRIMFFYVDPAALPVIEGSGVTELRLPPRLFFEDAALLSTARKLASIIERPDTNDCSYFEALGRVLAHELADLGRDDKWIRPSIRGGLAAWQRRIVTAYIEEHIAEPIAIAKLAQLAGLSTYHFCRAFKHCMGVPPHRFHTSRRIEHAKSLLAQRSASITEIGFAVGFSDTSAFATSFRKATGLTPSAFRRSA